MPITSNLPGTDELNDLPDDVRAVTDNEVSFFKDNGWVFLKGLVSRQLCQAMLERGRPRLEEFVAANPPSKTPETQRRGMSIAEVDEGTLTDIRQWVEWRGPVRSAHDPAFSQAALAKTMGRNVQRLLGRDKAMRIYHDIFVCKLPDKGSIRTAWHQDSPNFPIDRNALTVWIALDEITPEQGPVRFYSGSHRCGLLAAIPPHHKFDVVDEYPELAQFPVSPAHHMQPGDCTVHHGLVVHGASANNSPNPRWSYLVCYFPADARYTGFPNHDTDGFGLKVGHTLDHPSFSEAKS